MEDPEPLKVIQAARLFAERIVELTNHFPRRAPSGLRRQLVEAAQSIGNTLAEGFGRQTTGEKIHYSRMANGSVEETQNQLRLCVNTQLIDRKTFFKHWNLAVTISLMIVGLIAHLERKKDME